MDCPKTFAKGTAGTVLTNTSIYRQMCGDLECIDWGVVRKKHCFSEGSTFRGFLLQGVNAWRLFEIANSRVAHLYQTSFGGNCFASASPRLILFVHHIVKSPFFKDLCGETITIGKTHKLKTKNAITRKLTRGHTHNTCRSVFRRSTQTERTS